MCYGVWARPVTPTKPEYIVSTDPEDPIFYSTCYVREANITWLTSELEENSVSSPWRFNGQCLDCVSYHKNNNLDDAEFPVPHWVVTKDADGCYDCDATADTQPQELVNYTHTIQMYESRYCEPSYSTCSGGSSTCTRRMNMVDRNTLLNFEECKAAVARDMECGNWFSYSSEYKYCDCYKIHDCCGDCTPSRPTETDTWQIYEVDAGPPNPTCLDGLLSEDGSMCCDIKCVDVDGNSVCGVDDRCHDSLATVDAGACCKPGLLKTCSLHGPPCLM